MPNKMFEYINANSAAEVRPGVNNGKVIRTNVSSLLAPATVDASSRSGLIDLITPEVIRNTKGIK